MDRKSLRTLGLTMRLYDFCSWESIVKLTVIFSGEFCEHSGGRKVESGSWGIAGWLQWRGAFCYTEDTCCCKSRGSAPTGTSLSSRLSAGLPSSGRDHVPRKYPTFPAASVAGQVPWCADHLWDRGSCYCHVLFSFLHVRPPKFL